MFYPFLVDPLSKLTEYNLEEDIVSLVGSCISLRKTKLSHGREKCVCCRTHQRLLAYVHASNEGIDGIGDGKREIFIPPS